MKENLFVIDYEVSGSIVVSCRNAPAAKLHSRALIKNALRGLCDISVDEVEQYISAPTDLQAKSLAGGNADD